MIALLALACTDDVVDTGQANVGPVLTHTAPTGPFLEGDDILIEVDAQDAEDGVGGVSLVYRTIDGAFSSIIELEGSDGGGTWTGTIPGEDVQAPGVSYYFKAVDLGDPQGVSYLPDDLEEGFQVTVDVTGEPLPFFEDFELDEGQVRMESLGWANASLSFPGYHWNLNEVDPWDGEHSAIHQRGHETVDPMDDWLISPALDFTGVDRVQVSWYERGGNVENANHSLWISSGSRDPNSDDWTEITTLAPPPEGEWGRSAVVDLGEVDGTAVYIAWRYQGQFTDEWRMDGVEVKALTADLHVENLDWTPNPVFAGESATLNFDLTNAIDAAVSGVTLTASAPDGGATFPGGVVDIGPISGLETLVQVEVPVDIDAAWPDNSYLPIELTFEDDAGSVWTFEQPMVVGYPSEGRIDLTVVQDGLISIDVGVGDPDAPDWQEALYANAETAGSMNVTWDLTERYASLPPGPGGGRWFAKITAGGQAIVSGFEIDHGDSTYEATDLPTILPDETVVVYVPQPADPQVTASSFNPASPQPGGSVDLSVTLRNQGAATAGATTLELTSTDPHVTIDDGGPLTLTSGVWSANQSVSSSGYSITISGDHLDSTPVDVVWVVDDGAETFTVPMEVPVPWPVMKVTAVDIDDGDGGDDDGLLEPGETAEIEFEVTNVGGLSTFGFVKGQPTLAGTSTATATWTDNDENWGSFAVNVSKDEKFVIEVDSSSNLGDTLDIVLQLRDDDTTYDVPLQIVLGEPPWLSVSAIDDPIGDALGYGFDIVNAQYRCDGQTFELILESAEPYPASSFVEMFALPTAGDYDLFRVVYNAGSAKVQAYEFNSGQGFFTITTPTVTEVDSTHLKLSWDVTTMGLATDNLSVAFGSGWCGSQTGSFCDHFANGWGYYYSGYYSSRFFSVKW